MCGNIAGLRKKFGYEGIDLLIVENNCGGIWKIRQKHIGDGIFRIKTKENLMPIHYQDVTPAQRAILDRIFKQIRLNVET
ncbi:MAG: hypothetical protein LBF28_03040 [Rickettsiales bacterium]|nr:hypothetical protein [Rickettsiales bacterium]